MRFYGDCQDSEIIDGKVTGGGGCGRKFGVSGFWHEKLVQKQFGSVFENNCSYL